MWSCSRKVPAMRWVGISLAQPPRSFCASFNIFWDFFVLQKKCDRKLHNKCLLFIIETFPNKKLLYRLQAPTGAIKIIREIHFSWGGTKQNNKFTILKTFIFHKQTSVSYVILTLMVFIRSQVYKVDSKDSAWK